MKGRNSKKKKSLKLNVDYTSNQPYTFYS